MRLLHTADLHLGRGGQRSVAALDALLDAAEREGVDALTVGGDCFDSAAAADELRPELRERFTDNPFDVLVVPGNHDVAAFRENVEFGPDFRVLSADPFEVAEVDGGEVVGVPYRERLGDDTFFELRERAHEDAVLCLHCTLDAGFGAGATGSEEAPSYCPVQTETLGELGYEFVLAGHVHAELYQRKLPNGGLFIYPGSPVSHSWAETGRRHAVVVDTDDANVQPVALDTYYRDRFEATVTPGEGYEVIDRVEGGSTARTPTAATWKSGSTGSPNSTRAPSTSGCTPPRGRRPSSTRPAASRPSSTTPSTPTSSTTSTTSTSTGGSASTTARTSSGGSSRRSPSCSPPGR
ncbi:exonuclease SbcCD subunit D [Halosimplex aquaticum]